LKLPKVKLKVAEVDLVEEAEIVVLHQDLVVDAQVVDSVSQVEEIVTEIVQKTEDNHY
jgi:hypothetical protein